MLGMSIHEDGCKIIDNETKRLCQAANVDYDQFIARGTYNLNADREIPPRMCAEIDWKLRHLQIDALRVILDLEKYQTTLDNCVVSLIECFEDPENSQFGINFHASTEEVQLYTKLATQTALDKNEPEGFFLESEGGEFDFELAQRLIWLPLLIITKNDTGKEVTRFSMLPLNAKLFIQFSDNSDIQKEMKFGREVGKKQTLHPKRKEMLGKRTNPRK